MLNLYPFKKEKKKKKNNASPCSINNITLLTFQEFTQRHAPLAAQDQSLHSRTQENYTGP